MRSSCNQKPLGNCFASNETRATRMPEADSWKDDRAIESVLPTAHQHFACDTQVRSLNGEPTVTVESLIASQVVDWEAQTHASLDPNWTLQLDGFSFAEPQSQAFADVMMLDCPPSPPSIDHHDPFFHHTAIDNNTRLKAPSSSVSSLVDEDLRSIDLARSPELTERRPSASPNLQLTKKPSKRKRISSLLSRKKQTIEKSETNRSEVIDLPKHPQAPSASSLKLVVGADGSSRVSPLAHGHASRIIKTDWIADWERESSARRLDHPVGICRDVNVADCDRRPLSWPRRRLFRKSLDISNARLIRNSEKKP